MALENLTPATRIESILDGEDITPATRLEYFLKKAAEGGGGGGGILRVGITYDGETYDIDKTWTEVADAIENDKIIILEDLVDYQGSPAIPFIEDSTLRATLVGVQSGDGYAFLTCIWVEINPSETPGVNADVHFNSGTVSITSIS